MKLRVWLGSAAILLGLLGTLASTSTVGAQGKLAGSIKADGSSTVFLISEAMAASFGKLHPDDQVAPQLPGSEGGEEIGVMDVADDIQGPQLNSTAHRCLCLRFKRHLVMPPARLEVRMDSLLPSFPVELLHPLCRFIPALSELPVTRAQSPRRAA